MKNWFSIYTKCSDIWIAGARTGLSNKPAEVREADQIGDIEIDYEVCAGENTYGIVAGETNLSDMHFGSSVRFYLECRVTKALQNDISEVHKFPLSPYETVPLV